MYIGKKHARYQYYLWLIHKLISGPVLNLIRLISRLNMIERNMVLIISHLNPIYIIVLPSVGAPLLDYLTEDVRNSENVSKVG